MHDVSKHGSGQSRRMACQDLAAPDFFVHAVKDMDKAGLLSPRTHGHPEGIKVWGQHMVSRSMVS